MKLIETPEQIQFQQMLSGFFTLNCPTSLVRQMKDPSAAGYPAALWDALAANGLLGLTLPDAVGGQEAGIYELGLFFRQAGRVLCPTLVYSTVLFGVALNKIGSAEQVQRHLRSLVAGELKAAVVCSNPADSNDIEPTVVATRHTDGWELQGRLAFVPQADDLDLLLVMARSQDGSEPSRLLGFLIRPGGSGWSSTAATTISGERRCLVDLSNYPVAAADTVAGPDGTGLVTADVRWLAQTALALQCMEMVGGTEVVLEQTVAYIKNRTQFNRSIASFQAAQHLIANIRIGLDGARLAAAQAVYKLGLNRLADREVAIAKMHCSQAYKMATLDAHQLQGGMGYVLETDLHLWSERAKMTEVQGGTADIAATWLQQALGLTA